MKICGIYYIRNRISGKVYIGGSKNINQRFYYHRYRLIKKNHDNRHLQHAWNKYGESNFIFEIVQRCQVENLDATEQVYIDCNGNKYNIAPEANLPPMTAETKAKIGAANKGKTSWIKGKHQTLETKIKISQANKINNYMKGKTGSLHPNYGKHFSAESKAKMRLAKLGKTNNHASKPVLQTNNNIVINEFPSIMEAQRISGINAKNISACVCGKRKKAGGFGWRYK